MDDGGFYRRETVEAVGLDTSKRLENGLYVPFDPIASGTRVRNDGESTYNWALFERLADGGMNVTSIVDDNEWNNHVGAIPGRSFAQVSVRSNRFHTLVTQFVGLNI